MADAIDFQLRLIDRMTAPARQMQRSIGALEKSLKAVDKTGSVFDDKQRRQAIKPMAIKAIGPAAPDQQGGKAKALADKAAAVMLAKSRAADEKRLAQAMRAEDKREKALMAAERKAYALSDRFKKQKERDELKAARAAEKAAKDRMKSFKDAADIGGLQGPELMFERMGKALEVLKTPMGAAVLGIGAIAAAAVLATAAVVAFTAGLVALGVAGAKLALSAAGARKDLEITLEAMLGSQEAAARTTDGINRITNEVAITTEKARALVSSLATAGLKNEAVLLGTVKAIGQAESVVEGAGAKLEAIIQRSQTPKAWLTPMGVQLRKVFQISPEDLQGTGVTIQEFYKELGGRIGKSTAEIRFMLAYGRISAEEGTKALNAAVDKKLGGAAEKKMLGLNNQLTRLKQNFTQMFEGVKVEGFLRAIKAVIDVFDQTTVSGKSLKVLVEGVFNPLFQMIENGAPTVKIFLKGLAILGLEVYIAFKPLLKSLGLIGKSGQSDQEGLMQRTIEIGEAAGKAAKKLADMIQKLVELNEHIPISKAAWEGFKLALETALDPIGALTDRAGQLGKNIGSKLLEAVPKWFDAGKSLVRGLINGVTQAGTELIDSVRSLGDRALKAFKDKFKIASPSRVTMGFGANISMGLAHGIKAKAGVAQEQMAKVIPIAAFRGGRPALPPPRAVAPAAQGGSGGQRGPRSSGGITLIVEKDGIHIHLEGATTPEEVRNMLPEVMADMLEKFAESQGVDRETNGAAA
jgi:hypothetical protein